MQPTKKISQLPPQPTPTITDKVPIVSAGITDYALMSDLIALFFANATGANSPVTRQAENSFDFVYRGTGVWSADNVGVNRNASMSALTVYINGRRISILAVAARTFTASKDTYVDVLDNLDGTGTLVYTEVSNNAASPSLAANSLRLAIIVTGATTIAAAGSINQGQEDRVLPIASSIAYSVTDSLGNLICPRDPARQILGYRQIISDFTTGTGGSDVDITGLSVPVIVPSTRKILVTVFSAWLHTAVAGTPLLSTLIKEGSTGLSSDRFGQASSGLGGKSRPDILFTPTSGLHTYKAALSTNAGAATSTFDAASTWPAYIKVELK